MSPPTNPTPPVAAIAQGGIPIFAVSSLKLFAPSDELFAQARQFEARTGKPYLIQSNVADTAFAARNLYTYMMAEGAVLLRGFVGGHNADCLGATRGVDFDA